MKAFEIFKSKKDNQFYFNLLDIYDENKTLVMGEGYKSKRGRNVGINSLKLNGLVRDNYELRKTDEKVERDYFVIKAQNGEIVGTSRIWDATSDLSSFEVAEKKITATIKVLLIFKK